MTPGTTERLTRSPFLASVLLYTCFASALSSSAIAQADPTHVVSPATFPGTSWTQIASHKEAGWSKEKLAAAQAYANADSIHTSAVMVVQGGEVVDQWGDINQKI
ncbi:MAG TPA: hypothetical protein VNZ03_03695, partial [Terriglobales bacterium]|nr:hypothetical protein [Terriglobales bacterium]